MDRFSRRQFLSSSSIAVAALGAGVAVPSVGWAEEKKGMRTLGRTGLEVTQISFGGLDIGTSALLQGAIDNGINLIHVGTGYVNGKAIRMYGEVMKERRKDVVLALKEDPINGIDEALKLLNTDHVDILMPGLHSVEEISNPELPGAFEKLKKEGKIRFTGFAVHKNIPEVLEKAIELGFYDVMMPSYHTGNRDQVDPLLAKAKKEHNMGFMAMKPLRGVKKEGKNSTPEEVKAIYADLLKNPQVDSLVIGMGSFNDLNTNIEACFQKYSQAMPESVKEISGMPKRMNALRAGHAARYARTVWRLAILWVWNTMWSVAIRRWPRQPTANSRLPSRQTLAGIAGNVRRPARNIWISRRGSGRLTTPLRLSLENY